MRVSYVTQRIPVPRTGTLCALVGVEDARGAAALREDIESPMTHRAETNTLVGTDAERILAVLVDALTDRPGAPAPRPRLSEALRVSSISGA